MLVSCSTRSVRGDSTRSCVSESSPRHVATHWPSSSYLTTWLRPSWQVASRFPGPGLAGQIEQSFLERVGSLPDDTRRLLLVAAAEPLGEPSCCGGRRRFSASGRTPKRPPRKRG